MQTGKISTTTKIDILPKKLGALIGTYIQYCKSTSWCSSCNSSFSTRYVHIDCCALDLYTYIIHCHFYNVHHALISIYILFIQICKSQQKKLNLHVHVQLQASCLTKCLLPPGKIQNYKRQKHSPAITHPDTNRIYMAVPVASTCTLLPWPSQLIKDILLIYLPKCTLNMHATRPEVTHQ